MTSKVTVVLTTTPTEFPVDTPAPGFTRVEILDASGNVAFSQNSGYEFSGVADGDYAMRATLLDVNGNQIGMAFTQAFSVVTQPLPPTTTTIDIPTGASITVTPE
jgi:hypothetical protein